MFTEAAEPIKTPRARIKGFGIVAPLGLLVWRRFEPRDWRRYISPLAIVPCFLFAEVVVPAQKAIRPWITDRYGPDLALIVKLDTIEMKEMFWGLCVMFAALSIYWAWDRKSGEEKA